MNKEFIEEVKRMRQAQKEYFKTRSKEWLLESKKREANVDKMLKTISEQTDNLFTKEQ